MKAVINIVIAIVLVVSSATINVTFYSWNPVQLCTIVLYPMALINMYVATKEFERNHLYYFLCASVSFCIGICVSVYWSGFVAWIVSTICIGAFLINIIHWRKMLRDVAEEEEEKKRKDELKDQFAMIN